MRLALGTAQFGLPYGVANQIGQVSCKEIKSILDISILNNINTLDTAIAYGESEECLGLAGVENFKLVTKLPEIPKNCIDISAWIFNQVDCSLARLNIKKMHGLLLHRPEQLLDDSGHTIYEALESLRKRGLVEKIGVSIYSPDELDKLIPKYRFDLVQAPFNLIDQRLYKSGWLNRLKDDDIEIHTRSTFLQGLLLMSHKDIPSKFHRWNYLWQSWDQWLKMNYLHPLDACLDFAFSFPEIDKVIVGVDSESQFVQILKSMRNQSSISFPNLACDDLALINPMNWNNL